MPESAFSAKVTATSPPQPAPMPPVLGQPTFENLRAKLPITLPAVDVNGNPLGAIAAIGVYFGPAASDLVGAQPKIFSGPFLPGTDQYTLEVEVPAWDTAYDFEAMVTI